MLVGKWLRGIGLDYAVPTFEAAGIVTAEALSELDPSQHFEALGVTSPDDRRKLFFLVQRVKQAHKTKASSKGEGEGGGSSADHGAPKTGDDDVDHAAAAPTKKDAASAASATATGASSGTKLGKIRGGSTANGSSSSSTAAAAAAAARPASSNGQGGAGRGPRRPALAQGATSGRSRSENHQSNGSSVDHRKEEEPIFRSADAVQQDDVSIHIAPSASLEENGPSAGQDAANNVTASSTGLQRPRPSLSSKSRRLSGVPLPTKRRTSGGGPMGAESLASEVGRATTQRPPPPQQQQPPGVSARTGKALSSIPSEAVAPMSPLISVSLQDDEDDCTRSRPLARARGTELVTQRTGRRASNLRVNSHETDGRAAEESKSALSNTPPVTAESGALARPQGRGGVPENSATPPSSSSNPFAAQIERLRERNASAGSASKFRIDPNQRVSVVVRKRPASHNVDMLQVVPPHRLLVYQPRTRVDLRREVGTTAFHFDGVVDDVTSNATVYENVVQPLLPNLSRGQNVTVFCFGQTNSGKTHTLLGSTAAPQRSDEGQSECCDEPPPSARTFAEPGLYYLAAVDMFDMLTEMDDLTVTVSLLELYDRKVLDLLNDRASIPCWEDGSGKVQFPGLSLHRVTSADQLQRLVEKGHSLRSIGTTSKNNESSRSHAVLQLHIHRAVKRTQCRYATMTFIDLAGSERGADTALFSSTTRMEGAEINTSLLALKEVLRAMSSTESTHVPIRGSKLTQILKESLVDSSSTCVMIACVCPNLSHCEPTLNTLRYANCLKEFEKSKDPNRPRTGPKLIAAGSVRSPPVQNSLKSPSPLAAPLHPISSTPSPSLPSRTSSAISEVSADASAVLDDILSSPGEFDGLSPENESLSRDHQRMAAQSLLHSHKESMTAMLAMAKDEMTLVCNHSGDSLEATLQYMEETQSIQARQLACITNLREALLRYYEACESDARHVGDESFEDLRE